MTKQSPRALRHQHAYTLIEIIMTLFIFAIVSVIVVMVLQNITNTRDAIQKKSHQLADAQKSMTIITRDLQQIVNRRIRNETGRIEAAVQATGDAGEQMLTFTRAGFVNPGSQQARSTLQRVQYRVENKTLYREFWPTLDRDQATTPEKLPLFTDVESVSWRYLDPQNRASEFWPPTGRLAGPPRAIEMTLKLEGWGEIKRLILIPQERLDA